MYSESGYETKTNTSNNGGLPKVGESPGYFPLSSRNEENDEDDDDFKPAPKRIKSQGRCQTPSTSSCCEEGSNRPSGNVSLNVGEEKEKPSFVPPEQKLT